MNFRPLKPVFLIAVALVVTYGAYTLWHRYRPLRETEQKLVGTWSWEYVDMSSPRSTLTLTSDRRIVINGEAVSGKGRWYTIDHTLYMPGAAGISVLTKHPLDMPRYLTRDVSNELIFESDDVLLVKYGASGDWSRWQRVGKSND